MGNVITIEIDGNNTHALDISEARGAGMMVGNSTPVGDYELEVSLDKVTWAKTALLSKVVSEPLFIDLTNLTANYVRLAGTGAMAGSDITAVVVSQH
jgi:hypothetical protein